MPRPAPFPTAALLASLALALPAPAARADGNPPVPDHPTATLDACRTAADDGGPSLTATGAVPAAADLPGATLGVRFVLLARRPGEDGFAPVDGGDQAWVRSAPGAAGLVWSRTIRQLVVPAAYRVRVRLRWVVDGTTARVTTRTTAVCRQPAPTP